MFALRTGDFDLLAKLLTRWICGRVMPSELQKEFPSIEMGKVAHYYEQGRGIEGEFVESWDHIERFYDKMNFPPAEAIRNLIKAMRAKGYDHTLRAGQSLYTLILSRSRRHGLKEGQPNIAFRFSEEGMKMCPQNLSGAEMTIAGFVLNEAIEAQLHELATVPID